MERALITGCGGLIGSEAVRFFCERDFEVTGVDNDMRAHFFGQEASTSAVIAGLEWSHGKFRSYHCDIRDQDAMESLFKAVHFDLIIHTAAQPSHDWAAKEPHTDFTINANGTLNLLENCRKHCPDAVFIFTSTNKVYGDRPNTLPYTELEYRWEIDPQHLYANGIDESMSVDNSLHSLFGASKLAADVLVQEYGKYFGLKTTVFRGGCLTGPMHQGVELHGFLNYLVKCAILGRRYRLFGYKGKQVRDNIHSYDLVNAFYHVYRRPRQGEVYNIGGSRHSHCSVLEACSKVKACTGMELSYDYVEQNRIGDHIWYVSDVSKFRVHYPEWQYKYNLDMIIEEIVRSFTAKAKAAGVA